MKTYFAWLRNVTSSKDDEPIKIKASSLEEARQIATNSLRGRFLLRGVYSRKEFKELYPWWHAVMWGSKAVNK